MKSKFQLSGALLMFMGILLFHSSCSVPTSCGQTKKQAKAQHKKYQWRAI